MTRTALADAQLSSGDAQAAVDLLAPILESPDSSGPLLLVEALLLDAAARGKLGEMRAAEADIESALELAERDQLIWPFLVTPAREFLERQPRHHTAHGGLLKDVLDLAQGSSRPAGMGEPATLPEELSESELRVLRYLPSNLSSSEIAGELFLSVHTTRRGDPGQRSCPANAAP
jgi:LuxR family transcriptional regulator, maltose regulon positive regulatory protein